jgi:hypothetical protein
LVGFIWVILFDLGVSRGVYCFLFLLIKLISKSEKEKLLLGAKEYLFFSFILETHNPNFYFRSIN